MSSCSVLALDIFTGRALHGHKILDMGVVFAEYRGDVHGIEHGRPLQAAVKSQCEQARGSEPVRTS